MICSGYIHLGIIDWIAQHIQLQVLRTNRMWRDFGLNPLLGNLCLVFSCVLLVFFIQYKTEFVGYILLALGIYVAYLSNSSARIDFYRSIYTRSEYHLARFTENFILSLPFYIAFLILSEWLCLVMLLISTFLFSFWQLKKHTSFVLWTPFGSRPFEFIVGIRKFWWLYLIELFLMIMAILAKNYNLALFSCLSFFLIGLGFYQTPENENFVRIYTRSPKEFLIEKITVGTAHNVVLSIPIFILFFFFFDTNFVFILIGISLISLFHLTIILAKYSVYPRVMNIPEAILLGLCLILPIFLPFAIFRFHKKALSKLDTYLSQTSSKSEL